MEEVIGMKSDLQDSKNADVFPGTVKVHRNL